MKRAISIFLILLSFKSFSQIDTCSYVDISEFIDGISAEEANLEANASNSVTKFILDLKKSRSQGRNDLLVNRYIPVVFTFITTDNAPIDEMFAWEEDVSVMTNTEEWCQSVLDTLNVVYSTGAWRSGTGLNEDAFPLQGDVDTRIRFIPGNVDTLGQPMEWVRNVNFDDFKDDRVPFYERDNSYLDLSKPMPYYAESISYPGVNGFSQAAVYNNHTMMNTFGYSPYKYLNFFIIGPIALQPEYNAGQALYPGWSSFPLSKAYTPKRIEDNIWMGNIMYMNSRAWRKKTSVPAHEIAHFFSIGHVFNGTSSCEEALEEWETGSCHLTGDRFCDTYPTPQDASYCYDTNATAHCLDFDIPHNPSNIMDYTSGCDVEHFTQEQADKIYAIAISDIYNRTYIADQGDFIIGHDGGCLSDPSACNYSPNGSLEIECVYDDALGICGGSCEFDIDSDGICDDVDPCTSIECDPCKGITEIDGILINKPVSVVSIGNRCWTTKDLQGGPQIMEALQIHYKERGEDFVSQEPSATLASYANVSDAGYLHSISGYNTILFNWYFIEEYDVCPTGWHVSTDSDWMDLEMAFGVPQTDLKKFNIRKNETITSQIISNEVFYDFEMEDNTFTGYIDSFGFIRDNTASGYYWTTDEFRTPWPSRRDNAIYRRVLASDYFTKPTGAGTYRTVTNDEVGIVRAYSTNRTSLGKTNGMSVRCVKDLD